MLIVRALPQFLFSSPSTHSPPGKFNASQDWPSLNLYFTLDFSPEHQVRVSHCLLEPLLACPTDVSNSACPKLMACQLKSTLPPGFPQSENDILVVWAKNLCVILNSTFSSLTSTFNESISLKDFIYRMFLCSIYFHLVYLHPGPNRCICPLTGLLLQLRSFSNLVSSEQRK